MKVKDITGQVFGRLKVLQFSGINHYDRALWLCRCSCGIQVTVVGCNLRRGNTVSCGCYAKDRISGSNFRHGHAVRNMESSTHRSWHSMRDRVLNSSHKSFKAYGGRGIKISPRWDCFENFLRDMGERPSGSTLGRINNSGDYEPGNCVWESSKAQANNRRSNIVLEFRGKTLTLAQWSSQLDIPYARLHKRIQGYGWSVERALTTPSKSKL